MFQPWIASTETLFAVLTVSSVLYFVYKMSERDYLGEFEHIVLLAVLRLGGQAYSVTVRREIEARNQARGFYRCRLCHPSTGWRQKVMYDLALAFQLRNGADVFVLLPKARPQSIARNSLSAA